MLLLLTKSSELLPCVSDEKEGEGENFFGADIEGDGDSFGEEVIESGPDDRDTWLLKDLLDSNSSMEEDRVYKGGLRSVSSFGSFISILPDLDLHGIGEGNTTLSLTFSSIS